MTSPLRAGRGGLVLAVRATPGASREEVGGLHLAADGTVSLIVKVTAAADKGQANKAIIEALSRASDLPKSAFTLISGETGRNKTLRVSGNPASLEALMARIVNAGKES